MMTFYSAVVLTGFVLVATIFLSVFILRKLGFEKLSLPFALGHGFFIGIVAAIYFFIEKDAQHQMVWILPGIFDLPISLLLPVVTRGNVTITALFLAIAGSAQYAAIGWGIDWLKKKNAGKKVFGRKQIVSFVLVIAVIGVAVYIRDYMLAGKSNLQIELSSGKVETISYYNLDEIAKSSFNAKEYKDAKKFAEVLLSYAASHKKDWHYGNAVYAGNMVLGRLALSEGDIETAEQYLFAAAGTPGSPQLNSFGPNMSLANDLLAKGRHKVVIEFLFRCKRFWRGHEGDVDRWIEDIGAGRTPYFGPNMDY